MSFDGDGGRVSGSSNLFLYDIHVSPVHYQTLSLTDPSSPYPPPLQLGQYEPHAHLGHFQRSIILADITLRVLIVLSLRTFQCPSGKGLRQPPGLGSTKESAESRE